MGEFNVNKSTGDLLETAGMPSEYPATQVMLSDGVTSVEDRFNSNGVMVKSVTADGIKTLSAILDELYSARSSYNYIDLNGIKAYPAAATKYSAITCTNNGEPVIYSIILKQSGSICKVHTMSSTGTAWTISDISSNIPTQGNTYRARTMY